MTGDFKDSAAEKMQIIPFVNSNFSVSGLMKRTLITPPHKSTVALEEASSSAVRASSLGHCSIEIVYPQIK